MPSLTQDEIAKYWEIFQQQQPQNGFLSGTQMMGVLQNSQLPNSQLEQVWNLSDIDGDGRMDFEEFCIAMRLVFDALKAPGQALPAQLPAWLVPSSKQHLLDAKQALGGGGAPRMGSDSLIDDVDLNLKQDFSWYISPSERREYETVYSVNSDHRGTLSFDSLNELYATLTNVPSTDVSSAWNLVNPKSYERIDKEQSIVFLHILNQRHRGVRLPRSVPASLRASFGKEKHNYSMQGSQADVAPLTPTKANSSGSGSSGAASGTGGFAENYMNRLGLGGRTYNTSGTDFTESSGDWEEVRLRRELTELDEKLAAVEKMKKQAAGGASSSSAVVKRELTQLLAYKEAQLREGPSDVGGAQEEIDMVAEQLEALRDHYRTRQSELASIETELAAL